MSQPVRGLVCLNFLEGEIMNEQLQNIATRITPVSVRIGLDVDILDVTQNNYEYSRDGVYYENSVVAIQMKHKFIEEPFWLTLFVGAFAKRDEGAFVAAYEDCPTGSESPLYYADRIRPEELEDGSESLQEIITAFNFQYFTEDDSDDEHAPMFYDDPQIIWDYASEIEEANNVVINRTVLHRENASMSEIKSIQSKLDEVKKTRTLNVYNNDDDSYTLWNTEERLIRNYVDIASASGSEYKLILYVASLEKILNLLETSEEFKDDDYTNFRIYLNDLVQLDADMYIFN